MPARKIKSLYPELGHRRHREHRSKRGRQFGGKQDRYHRAHIRLVREELKNQSLLSELDLIFNENQN